MKKKKIKIIYKMVGTEKENEECVNRAYDILFKEVLRRRNLKKIDNKKKK